MLVVRKLALVEGGMLGGCAGYGREHQLSCPYFFLCLEDWRDWRDWRSDTKALK